jgi:hypothetical protein
MKRPRSVGVLGGLLAYFGFFGVIGVAFFLREDAIPVAPSLLLLDNLTTTRVLQVLAVLYVGALLTAAFAILQQRFWAVRAYLVFLCTVALYHIGFLSLIRVPAPLWLWLVYLGVVGGLLFWGWRVVERHFSRKHADAV